MPVELHIIRASEFIRVGPSGHLDLEGSRELLKVMAAACHTRGIHRALLDLRALPVPAKRLFTPADLAALVGTFREAGFSRQQRLAVLYQNDPHKGARLFAFIGTMRGWQVRAFSDFEEALLWLSDGTPVKRAHSGEKKIPVPIVRRKVESKRMTGGFPEGPGPGEHRHRN